jgi:formamidase
MAVHEVRVDRSKTLVQQPATGHNRWHPGIAPIVRCEPGDEVVLETRDAFDGQMGPRPPWRRWPHRTWTWSTR